MKAKLTVGYVTASDPEDKRSWSGIHYKMYESLSLEFENVILLGPIKKSRVLDKALRTLNLINLKLFSKRYNKHYNILSSKFYASKIKAKIKSKKIDVLFAPAAATEIAFLKTSIPICYLSDTSFSQINNYYRDLSGFSSLAIRESNFIEQKAIKNSTTQVYSSSWAAEHVINYYKADKSSVFTVSFGANIDFVPNEVNIKRKFDGTINFLFLGVEWERKGGDTVLEAFNILINRGYNITLTICGTMPPKNLSSSKIKIIPFLDKNNDDDNQYLLKIFHQTHLMFVPTRADCTPIVFCEASAFGIPVITTNTGGISSIVENGRNGYTLPCDSDPIDYVNQIQILLDNPRKMEELSVQSRKKFEEELNWNSWAKKMREILLLTTKASLGTACPQ